MRIGKFETIHLIAPPPDSVRAIVWKSLHPRLRELTVVALSDNSTLGRTLPARGRFSLAAGDWRSVFARLARRLSRAGVTVRREILGPETTGIFDGTSITLNATCDLETQCHNMGHAFGHIIQWSVAEAQCQVLYDELYRGKDRAAEAPADLERALLAFREYEVEASRYAVGLLLEVECAWAVPAFTNFARADIEAIVSYHRTGTAPIWDEFFAEWRNDVNRGTIHITPFEPLAIPSFIPIGIAPQQVVRGVREEG